MEDAPYLDRLSKLYHFATKDNVFVTPSYEIVATYENLLEYLERFLALGYEGLMIRTMDKGYENKRSWSLLKYKVFEDEEFELVGFEEDNRGGFVGAYIMKLPEPVTDRDGKVLTTFKAGASGQSQDERAEMLTHPENYLGRQATICFFGRSEYGVPRFGKLKAFRKQLAHILQGNTDMETYVPELCSHGVDLNDGRCPECEYWDNLERRELDRLDAIQDGDYEDRRY